MKPREQNYPVDWVLEASSQYQVAIDTSAGGGILTVETRGLSTMGLT